MALLIYNTLLFLYKVAIYLASPFNAKAQSFINGRKSLTKRLKVAFADNTHPVAWFHCASLGEFEQGRPVIEAFKASFPDHKILLTFFSPSGYEVRKNYELADYIFYMPTDTKINARKFVRIVQPSIAIFVKYEFWYHHLKALRKAKVPTLSISSIFRKDQLFFKWYGTFYKNTLLFFTHFFVQDSPSKALLNGSGIDNVDVAGDTRFDRVWDICSKPKKLPLVEKFKNGAQVMVVGSCWPEDIEVLNSFINQSLLKFIIAPHEINEGFLSEIKDDLVRKTVYYSKLTEENATDFEVLIIDNIGMLSSLYAYGEYAFVGGGYGKGLHNILEPATFGIPIFFGDKNYEKFREANDLTKLGSAVAVADYDAFRAQFRSFSEARTYEIASDINRDYVINNKGATAKIMNYCKSILT